MAESKRFEGRVAVVTGGASGIGFGAAARLLREGGTVAVWDRDAKALGGLAEKLGGKVHTEALDLADPDAVKAAADNTFKVLGRIDILVNSAGLAGPNHMVWDYPIDAWKRVMDVNVNGVFYCNRFVVPHMMANDYGRIVNIASIAGKEGNPTASAYSASKAAVIGLTKSLGKELAKTGIRVNAITPATVVTPILEQVSQAHIDYMLSKIPMGRFGTVDEMAAIICWLSSEEVSFTTGAVFDVSGGRATY
jgi:NAD(P)-dependent dehydrogenase (short-subunit alcohol dehydrogenase family)